MRNWRHCGILPTYLCRRKILSSHSRQIRLVTDASSRRPFPPTFALSLSRALYPDLTGTVAFHSGWPILAGRRLRSHRPISRSELANWVSSSYEIGIGNKRWNAAFEIKGATGQGLLAIQRNFKITETTSVQIETSVDPLLFPSALSLTVEATQNWRDLVPGGLSVGVSVGFSLGGILFRVRCVDPAILAPLRALLPDFPRPRMSAARETPDSTQWSPDGFVLNNVLSCLASWKFMQKKPDLLFSCEDWFEAARRSSSPSNSQMSRD